MPSFPANRKLQNLDKGLGQDKMYVKLYLFQLLGTRTISQCAYHIMQSCDIRSGDQVFFFAACGESSPFNKFYFSYDCLLYFILNTISILRRFV